MASESSLKIVKTLFRSYASRHAPYGIHIENEESAFLNLIGQPLFRQIVLNALWALSMVIGFEL